MVQRLFFIFAFLHPSIIPVHFHACILKYIYTIYNQIKSTIQKKRPTSCTQNECTTSAVIPLAPCTRPSGSEYIIKFINTWRISALGGVFAVVHQCRRGHQHDRKSGAGGSDQRAGACVGTGVGVGVGVDVAIVLLPSRCCSKGSKSTGTCCK